jgi:5'-nucleotidase (lipoprotein e(P4) family)
MPKRFSKNMSKTHLSVLFAFLLAFSVAATHVYTRTTAQQAQPAPVADNEYQAGAVLWFQQAAENRALAYQAFNLAKMRLDTELKACKKSRKKQPCAIVTDVDETILDNSPNQAWLVKNRQNFSSENWLNWVKQESAKPLAGSLDFINYAAGKGIKTFYVTNRNVAEKEATANNLKKVGFPEVTDETLLVRTEGSGKEPRRQTVAAKYRIVLLLGDNLNDFSDIFERKSIVDRFAAVDSVKQEFGSRFIVLPNPMYGDWESAVYDYNFRRTEEEKANIRRGLLQSY